MHHKTAVSLRFRRGRNWTKRVPWNTRARKIQGYASLFYRLPKLVSKLIWNQISNATESYREERRDIVCGEKHNRDGQTTGSQGNKSGEFLKQAPGTNHLNSKFNRQVAEAVSKLRIPIKSNLISRYLGDKVGRVALEIDRMVNSGGRAFNSHPAPCLCLCNYE